MQIGGLDVGTTGCKLTVYDDKGNFIHNEYVEYNVSRKNGAHEIDAEAIFAAVCTVFQKTCAVCRDLSAVGVTSFGESFAVLDENDRVLLPSMLYTDPRGAAEIKSLSESLGEEIITKIVGVAPHSMYSLPKIMWIRQNRPEVYAKIKCILLMQDYIVYKLTGKRQIDYSLAARTLAFDVRKKCWSHEILDAAEVSESLLSVPVPSGTLAGTLRPEFAGELGISANIQIVTGAHDQVAAAVGAGVFEVGGAMDGTGTVECVVPVFDTIPEKEDLYKAGYAVVPYVFEGTYVCYALSFTGGATLKWFRDQFAKKEAEMAAVEGKNVYALLDSAISEKPTNILILPHFAGAANPYMDNGSRAAIIGLTLEHTAYDLYKALMEGVTYEMLTNVSQLDAFGIPIDKLVATGGGAASRPWLQIKADILNRPIKALEAGEAGAVGTSMLTAVAIGLCADLHDARAIYVKEKGQYTPNAEKTAIYRKNYSAYKKLYAAVRPIVAEIEEEEETC